MKRLFTYTLMLFAAAPSLAADLNGYTAKYECRAGGQYCIVDVAVLGNRTCDQTIAPSTPWSSINWSNNTICIETGDHTGKGTLTIPSSANGNGVNYKVLRYTRANDNKIDAPWNQGPDNLATLLGLEIYGDNWLVHRLDINPSGNRGLLFAGNNVIVNRVWIHDGDYELVKVTGEGSLVQNSTIQNSVISNTGFPGPATDRHCIVVSGVENMHFVNNEIYNCAGDSIQKGGNSQAAGMVVENNDLYLTSAYYSDGSGNLTANGSRACAENGLDLKEGGSSNNPMRVIQNRIWGFRGTDTNCGGTGSAGEGLVFHAGTIASAAYGLISRNIFMDGTQAISAPNKTPHHWSIIGNLIYDFSGTAGGTWRAIDLKSSTEIEVYLNTVIDVAKGYSTGWINLGGGENKDVRCNVAVDGGTSTNMSGTGKEVNHQAYYNTTHASEPYVIDVPVKTRVNSITYFQGQVIRTSAIQNCSTVSDSACFLYKAMNTGTSHSNSPTPCTALGCIFSDGGVTWRAIRGPYTFYRKLQTNPELYVIPYAQSYADPNNSPEASAPEAYTCPSDYAVRAGLGINEVN